MFAWDFVKLRLCNVQRTRGAPFDRGADAAHIGWILHAQQASLTILASKLSIAAKSFCRIDLLSPRISGARPAKPHELSPNVPSPAWSIHARSCDLPCRDASPQPCARALQDCAFAPLCNVRPSASWPPEWFQSQQNFTSFAVHLMFDCEERFGRNGIQRAGLRLFA